MDKRERRAHVKNLLAMPNRVNDDLDNLLLRYEELETQATHITQEIKPVVGGGGGQAGKIEPIVLQMIAVSEKIAAKIRLLNIVTLRRQELLRTLNDSFLMDVTAAHFCDRKSYAQIGREYKLPRETVRKAVMRAVDAIKLDER